MTGENCLAGLKRPGHGNKDRLLVVATVLVDVTDGGADAADGSGTRRDESSMTRCPKCDRGGPPDEFHTLPGLPPDPEGMNDRRAGWGGTALAAFREATGADEEDTPGDLLCDLMHWCDRHGFDFAAAMDRAGWHYEAETSGEMTCPPTP